MHRLRTVRGSDWRGSGLSEREALVQAALNNSGTAAASRDPTGAYSPPPCTTSTIHKHAACSVQTSILASSSRCTKLAEQSTLFAVGHVQIRNNDFRRLLAGRRAGTSIRAARSLGGDNQGAIHAALL